MPVQRHHQAVDSGELLRRADNPCVRVLMRIFSSACGSLARKPGNVVTAKKSKTSLGL